MLGKQIADSIDKSGNISKSNCYYPIPKRRGIKKIVESPDDDADAIPDDNNREEHGNELYHEDEDDEDNNYGYVFKVGHFVATLNTENGVPGFWIAEITEIRRLRNGVEKLNIIWYEAHNNNKTSDRIDSEYRSCYHPGTKILYVGTVERKSVICTFKTFTSRKGLKENERIQIIHVR